MKNQDYLTRSLQAVWHPCTQMKSHEQFPLIPIERGEGIWLYDFDGNRYLDAVSSWWVNLFGHANSRINDAIKTQLERLPHTMLAGFTHAPVIELSEKLSALTDNKLGHCFYASDGASAVEIALKMSAHYWRNNGKESKCQFVALANGYHGETIGALAVTDIPLFREEYKKLVRLADIVPTPDWRNKEEAENAKSYAIRCANDLETYFQQHHENLAALIIEPLVQCATGMAMYHPEYLTHARQLCDKYNVHLIADEIAVGFGRTGTFFACDQATITPDFLCLSKGISGGYLPLSVVMTSDEIYGGFYHDKVSKGFLHSHSYTGNPLACSAALATLAIFDEYDVIETNKEKAAYANRCMAQFVSHPKIKNFRNAGMIWAFEVQSDQENFSRQVFELGLKNELLLRPIGNTVYFMPPYIINNDQIELLVERTLNIIESLS